MIAVKIYFNTYADGSEVPNGLTLEEFPVCIYGPFENIQAAIDWIDYDYPDGDTDVHDLVADDFDIPKDWYVNNPGKFKDGSAVDPVNPDEDIRTESREIHIP